jgi:hypothetical protein
VRKHWWPEAIYEAKPYGAVSLGLLAGVVALARSLAAGMWESPYMAIFVLGCAVMVYGGVVLQMRYEYRRRSRWNREHRD